MQKNYSILQQVNEMYYIENGEKIDAFTDYRKAYFRNYIEKYYNVIKDCGRYGCVEMLGKDSNLYKTYNGKDFNGSFIDDGSFVLADGTTVFIENPDMGANRGRIWVWFDVNGYGKKPNRVGVDLFAFELTRDGEFLPMGAKGTLFYGQDSTYCSKTSENNLNGINCTYKVLRGD